MTRKRKRSLKEMTGPVDYAPSYVTTIRLPESVVEKLDEVVEKNRPAIRSRSHLIEIAVAEWLRKQGGKS